MKNTLKFKKYEEIFSFQNILASFKEFEKGKSKKEDVSDFKMNLIGNLKSLHDDLMSEKYKHSGYKYFKIKYPKERDIHKALVRDRIVHHSIYRALYDYFNKFFIHDSYSCRFFKGSHRALKRFARFWRKESLNNKKTVWVLKCDIKKCFASVDQEGLKNILRKYISCPKILNVLFSVIESFSSASKKGIPLGNLTSQLFVNIYMNEFDQVIKRLFKVKSYIRYADDMIILSKNRNYLLDLIPKVANWLKENLKICLHPNKIKLKTCASGMDFLGWVHFPNYRVLRISTEKRMFKNIKEKEGKPETIQSYLGLLSHGNAFKLQTKIKKLMVR